MSTLIHSLRTASQYALTPNRYPFLWRRSIGQIFGAPESLEDTARQSQRWCQDRAITNSTALSEITGCDSLGALNERYPKEIQQAEKAVGRCPQKMGGGANMELLHDLVAATKATAIVETGVAYGWSSLAILLALQHHFDARLVSTNLHYREYESDDYVGCAVPQSLRSAWNIIRKADDEGVPEALQAFPNGTDLCHYDSDKSYEGRLRTYPLLWNSLKPGGLFISDDIQDNLAFAHFAKMTATNPLVTHAGNKDGSGKFVGLLQKNDNRPLRPLQF